MPGMDVRAEDTLKVTTTVAAPVEQAFRTFTEGLAGWWPREYTWAQDTLDTIAIEPRAGGRCFERGPHGFHCDWGRVLAWEPPRRLVFTWQIAPDRAPEPNPAKASEVEARFVADGPRPPGSSWSTGASPATATAATATGRPSPRRRAGR
jgi:uncharacterized protein YndB with AHSA1/START domain